MTNTVTNVSTAVLDLNQLTRQAELQAGVIADHKATIDDAIRNRGETQFLVKKSTWINGFGAGYRAALADVLEAMQADPDAEARLQETIERI